MSNPVTPPRAAGSAAGVTGYPITDDNRIMYQPTPYSRRENFALLHEAGHHHSEHDEALLNWVHQRPDPGGSWNGSLTTPPPRC